MPRAPWLKVAIPTAVVMALGAIAVPVGAQRAALPEVRVSAQPYLLPPPLIRTQASLVELDVVIRRLDGTVVAGLGRDSFRVFDNGQLRDLAAFSVAAPPSTTSLRGAAARKIAPTGFLPPRSIALFFDDVNTDTADLGNARRAALRFVHEALAPGDRVAVLTASSTVDVAFTPDGGALSAAIARIAPHPRQGGSALGACPRLTSYQAYLVANHLNPSALAAALAEKIECDKQIGLQNDDGTSVYTKGMINGMPGSDNVSEEVIARAESVWDQVRGASYDTLAAVRAATDYLAKQPGARIMLLASGGFLDGTLEQERDDIAESAIRAGVVINALDAKGLYADGPGNPLSELPNLPELPLPTFFFEETSKLSQRQAEDAALATFAESTGGLFFHDNNDLTVGFERLGVAPEVTYQLAFAPGDIPHDGKFHKLTVELASPGKAHDIVQARPGYFAPAAAAADPQALIADAMRSDQPHADVPATAAATVSPGEETTVFRLEVGRLPFSNQNGRRRLDLTFVAGLFDSSGRFVVGKQGEMDLALKPETWKRMAAEGLSARLPLAAPAGRYRLRVVVATGGQVTASSLPVQIP